MKENVMNQQMVHYKIYMCALDEAPEIRHFIVDKIVSHNYYYLIQKLTTLFPQLKNVSFSVHWRDREGDSIRICTDDEILIALNEMASHTYKKIFVKVAKQQENKELLHPGIICDECEQPVYGFKYKCLVCYDYELCADCEKSRVHPQHVMIRIPKPLTSNNLFLKSLAEEMPIIENYFERLWMQNTENNDPACGSRTSQNENKKQYHKVCPCKPRNSTSDMIYEKLDVMSANYNALKAKPVVYSPGATSSYEKIAINLGTDNLNNFADEHKSLTHRTGLLSSDVSINSQGYRVAKQSASGKEQDKFTNGESYETATTGSPFTISEALYTQESTSFQMDAAPIPSDSTPALQEQFIPITDECLAPVPNASTDATPPPARTFLTSVPLSRLVDPVDQNCSLNPHYSDLPPYVDVEDQRIPVFVPPRSPQDDVDYSWTLVNNEMRNSFYSSPPVIVASHTDPALTLSDFSDQGSESLYPNLTVPQFADAQDLIEDTMARLQLLGFANEEWLRTIVENKNGNVKEALRFLSPIKKPSTNLYP